MNDINIYFVIIFSLKVCISKSFIIFLYYSIIIFRVLVGNNSKSVMLVACRTNLLKLGLQQVWTRQDSRMKLECSRGFFLYSVWSLISSLKRFHFFRYSFLRCEGECSRMDREKFPKSHETWRYLLHVDF